MTAYTTTVHTADAVRLAVHRVGPADGTPVVLVPGTFSNHTFWLGTRDTGFARTLGAAGYDAWALDPRGHGRSQRPRADQRWDFDDWARHDVPAVLRAASADGRRPFVVGHSAGGAAVLAALTVAQEVRAAVRGVVVIATPLPWRQPLLRLPARIARAVARFVRVIPARLARIGPEDELSGVVAQWMSWTLDGHWRGDDGTDYEAGLAELRRPVLVVAGAGDRREAPVDAVRALYDRIGSRDREFLVCGRRTGFSRDFGHAGLVVSRAARVEVWPRLLAWLDARRAPDA